MILTVESRTADSVKGYLSLPPWYIRVIYKPASLVEIVFRYNWYEILSISTQPYSRSPLRDLVAVMLAEDPMPVEIAFDRLQDLLPGEQVIVSVALALLAIQPPVPAVED